MLLKSTEVHINNILKVRSHEIINDDNRTIDNQNIT